MEAKDSNGNTLNDGDSVRLIKDLKVKGASKTWKRGETVKNIRISSDPEWLDCKVGKSQIALKTCFVKKI
ncbi:MAG: alkylphosphonate utilization protein [Candidatus Hydrogenedentota bacterium]